MPRFVWTDIAERRLRHWFTVEGLSFAQIARRLGLTRNAVAGKIWRLGLIGQGLNPPRGGRAARRVSAVRRIAARCSWPIGDPKRPDFHFCGAPIPLGTIYCAEHSAKAYAKPDPSRRTAAARRGPLA